MGLFRRKKVETRSITWADLWGSGRDSLDVSTIDTALSLVPVYACVRLIADQVASLPIHVFRKTGDRTEQVDTPTFFKDPTQYGSSYDWVHRAMTSLLLRGNAFGYVTDRYETDGQPRQMEWLNPSDITIDDFRTIVRPTWRRVGQGAQQGEVLPAFPGGPLYHVPGFTLPGLVLGYSPIKAFALQIETGLLAERFSRDWFKNGSIPSGLIRTEGEVDEETATKAKAKFKEASAGRDLVVMGGAIDYTPLTVNPDDAQVIAALKLNATQVANIYGVPPEYVGGETGKSMTYQNTENEAVRFVKFCLQPYLAKLETAFSALIPRPQFVKFNLDALLRADTRTRYEAHKIGIDSRFLTPNEARELENRKPLPGGDQVKEIAPSPFDAGAQNDGGGGGTD